MYRFLLRPKWIGFHLLVVAAIVLMISLGFWQLRRLDERREFNDQVMSRSELPAEPLDAVLAEGDPDAIEWRTATVSGTYLPDEQFVVVNRSQGGRPGDNVVTPLQLDDGRIVLANRGFVPVRAEAAPPPEGEVVIEGIVRPSEERRRGQLSDPAEGELDSVQRVDIERMAPQLPGEVVPVYLDVTDSDPAPGGQYPERVAAPELSEGPHLGYAAQWFIFSVCVAIGWVLAVRRSVAQHRIDRAAAEAGTDERHDAEHPVTA